ncbi:CASP-like protein 5A1 isoform X1 [Vitis vinifera]|uniref:CASP-like protein 5A1 isoform X1 n=1 Tax=Vitis vinifera TaxID=29760 RepID=UPI0005400801|nr:CASP-like protein 5A1 isoform X1 [Vitis vinifera]|eukprot:XP_010653571.1 PREDICTED: CASP-like protein 5A1 isoform X1 [Vitis vinifera]
MFVSRPVVHPVEAPPLREGGNNAPRVRMKDVQGMAGTPGGLVLRLFQFLSAVVSLCVMVTISDFYSVTAFCYLVVAVSLQSLWSLSLAIMDIYALLVRRSLRNSGIISVFTVGDGLTDMSNILLQITSTLTFSAACASAGITVLIENDMDRCAMNPCTRFETATAMAFISWFAVSPSFFLNFWSLASR